MHQSDCLLCTTDSDDVTVACDKIPVEPCNVVQVLSSVHLSGGTSLKY